MLYRVRHSHRKGDSDYLVRCSHFPTEEEVVLGLELDFEPEKEEFLEIELVEGVYNLDTGKEEDVSKT